MENTTSPQNAAVLALLKQQVEVNRADLVGRYLSVLIESLFINRAEVRPNMVKKIASDEADAILNFLSQPAFSAADHGSQLHQIGLSDRVVLRLGHATRLFFLDHMESEQLIPMLEIVHTYQEAVFQGFVRGLEKYHLGELERTRNALQRGDSGNS
jgi:hypothetical protein